MINITKMHYVPTFYPPLVLHSTFPLFTLYRSNNVSNKSHIWRDAPADTDLPFSSPVDIILLYFIPRLDLKSVSDSGSTVVQWELFNFIAVG